MALVNQRQVTILRRSLLCIVATVFSWSLIVGSLQAEPDPLNSPWYVMGASDCNSSGSGGVNPSSGVDGGDSVRATGVQPPYIVEQFAIEVLKSVAQKRGVPEADVLTEEHVVALITFIHAEGGDITNRSSIFNPLNTGLNAPELIDGDAAADGTQAFKSFDAGVEGMARTIVGSNQSRLADTLTKPGSTAEEFFHALTYWNQYEGNWPYAGDSVVGDVYDRNGTPDPLYYEAKLALLQNVRDQYIDRAGTVMGTEALEWEENIREPSLVRYGGGSGNNVAGGTGDSACICRADGAGGPMIVLDPGHGGETDTIDAATNLRDHDFLNQPEAQDVMDVATLAKDKLTQEGYQVTMTKNGVEDVVSLRQRATIADTAGAALAVSIHDMGGNGGKKFADYAEIFAQGVGKYRTAQDGTNVEFTNQDVAAKSQDYAAKMATARAATEGRPVPVTDANFNGREEDVAAGNIPLVQLFSGVPWVYNEVGGNSGDQSGLNQEDKQKYADGIVEGVKQSIPLEEGAGGGECADANGVVQGNIAQTAVNFSWPTREEGKKKIANPAYAEAVEKFGPVPFGGADCGGFVGIVMHASGADTNYPKSYTPTQEQYVRDNPELYDVVDSVSSTEDLLPGDIMIVNSGSGSGSSGHTYIFVGAQPDGNDIAHASMNERMPNLDKAFLSDSRGSYMRARLKKAVE